MQVSGICTDFSCIGNTLIDYSLTAEHLNEIYKLGLVMLTFEVSSRAYSDRAAPNYNLIGLTSESIAM